MRNTNKSPKIPYSATAKKVEQVALLSQRGSAMLRVCQWLASTVQNVE